jgi:LysM repeat protein
MATAQDDGGPIVASATTPISPGGYDPQGGDLHVQFSRAMEKARGDADGGRLAEAHLELSKWYDQPQLSVTEQRHLIGMLDPLAGSVIYSHRHHLLLPPYDVRPGDTLASVAQSHHVPATLLAKVNGIDPAGPLAPGTKLKVLPGPFNAVVDLKNYRLTLFLQGRYAGRFPIGVGSDQSATPGDFEVQSVIENPTYPVAGGTSPTDQSASPFGRYWIDLGHQIGIHGTSEPNSVGRSTGARGCICLKDDDIEHVHDILSVGSKVLIRK